MQFALNERKVKITAVNPNRELHGDDPQPVCYLHFAINLLAEDLAMFHPALRSALFTKGDSQDLVQQGQNEGSNIRFAFLKLPLTWEDECVGAELRVLHGVSAKSHIVLSGSIVSKFKLTPMDGGTVVSNFMVTCHPEEGPLGRLGMMVDNEVVITIVPPKDTDGDLGGDDGEAHQ